MSIRSLSRKCKPVATGLPPLVFGEHKSIVSTDIDSYREYLLAVVGSLVKYENIGDIQAFRHKVSFIEFNDFRLTACANTPIKFEVSESDEITLAVPFYGSSVAFDDEQHYLCETGKTALLLPGMARRGSSGIASHLFIDIAESKILNTARAMLQDDRDIASLLRLDIARPLPLQYGVVRFDAIIKGLCKLMDESDLGTDILSLQMLDDIFYRTIVVMLIPGFFLGDAPSEKRQQIDNARFNSVTEYIMAHLRESISLTQLESVSGITARGLQHGFRKHYGCSPMQWVRQRRLELARSQLDAASREESVTKIALDCGFTRMGDFSRIYYQAFGEYPSDTLGREPQGL